MFTPELEPWENQNTAPDHNFWMNVWTAWQRTNDYVSWPWVSSPSTHSPFVTGVKEQNIEEQ